MTTRADEAVLGALHTEIAKELLRRITAGSATAADINVARQFLKDNGIESVPAKGSATQTLADTLPDLDDNVVVFGR